MDMCLVASMMICVSPLKTNVCVMQFKTNVCVTLRYYFNHSIYSESQSFNNAPHQRVSNGNHSSGHLFPVAKVFCMVIAALFYLDDCQTVIAANYNEPLISGCVKVFLKDSTDTHKHSTAVISFDDVNLSFNWNTFNSCSFIL